MILIGRYFSPFVRRTAVTMREYGITYEQRPLKVWDEANEVRAANPIGRVPSLIMDDGEILVDSSAIIDAVDQMVTADEALTPRKGRERRHVLTLVEIGKGAAEKAVAAQYERTYRPKEKIHFPWIEQCEGQSMAGFEALDRMAEMPWIAGKRMTQADVTAVVAWEFLNIINPALAERINCPKLGEIAKRVTNIPSFVETRPEV